MMSISKAAKREKNIRQNRGPKNCPSRIFFHFPVDCGKVCWQPLKMSDNIQPATRQTAKILQYIQNTILL